MKNSRKNNVRAKCCHQFETLPRHVKCFERDICAEVKRLMCRHNHMTTKRRRLLELAHPKRRIVLYKPKCACRFRKDIEIVRLEEPTYTRTQQLSYPSVRKLLLFKKAVTHLFPDKRKEIINRMLRKSLFSVYSRLANAQPPEERIPIHKWDKAEWKTHTKYLKKLAKHKVALVAKGEPNRTRPLKEMYLYKKLAKPKKREEFPKENWVLTPGMRKYVPSMVVAKLSQPRERIETHNVEIPTKISPKALKYKPTARIKELATAAEKRLGNSDLKENPFSVAPNAMKCKASQRTIDLAEPKEYTDKHTRQNPFAISPAALKCKPSPRIIILAKPKGS